MLLYVFLSMGWALLIAALIALAMDILWPALHPRLPLHRGLESPSEERSVP